MDGMHGKATGYTSGRAPPKTHGRLEQRALIHVHALPAGRQLHTASQCFNASQLDKRTGTSLATSRILSNCLDGRLRTLRRLGMLDCERWAKNGQALPNISERRKEDPLPNNFNIPTIPTSSAEHREMSRASPLAGAAGAVGGSEDPPAWCSVAGRAEAPRKDLHIGSPHSQST